MVLPSALILQTVAGLSRWKALLTAACLMIVSPFFFFNNTFTWTKDLTSAFVLMGTHTYLLEWRKRNATGMAASLAWLAPGFLAHYLTIVYAAILGLHLLYVNRRQIPYAALVRLALTWGLIVGSWFGYMFLNFGINSGSRS